jgi:polyhydroxyalkanoate synthesis repressor PhaR
MTTTKTTKTIKRYANRKLYDTERSCYVTLEEIAQMIKDGDDVKVVDNKTKDDLTAVTLAQIIVEEEKKVQKMPLKLLKSIIQSGTSSMGEAIGDFYADRVADPVKRIKDDVERRMDSLLKRDTSHPGPTAAPADGNGAVDDGKHGVIQEFVASTTEAFETWQKRIDERVKETIGRVSPASLGGASSVDALKARVAELEAKIEELAAKRR